MAGGSVPFHGRTEAGVEIGLAGGEQAEFDRAAADLLAATFLPMRYASSAALFSCERLWTTVTPSGGGRRAAIASGAPAPRQRRAVPGPVAA